MKIPQRLYPRCAFHFFLIPCHVVPVQIIKENDEGWDFIEIFIHPIALQYSFRYVPFVRISLKITKTQFLGCHFWKSWFAKSRASEIENSFFFNEKKNKICSKTFGLTVGNSWVLLISLNCMARLSSLRLLLKASQMEQCIGLDVSRPVKPIKAKGLATNSAGNSDMTLFMNYWKYPESIETFNLIDDLEFQKKSHNIYLCSFYFLRIIIIFRTSRGKIGTAHCQLFLFIFRKIRWVSRRWFE